MFYQEYQPHPSLTNYILCYWTLSLSTGLAPKTALHFLTEGGGFSFNLSDPLDCIAFGQSFSTVRRSCLCGPLTIPMRVQLNGKINIFGVRFQPGGSYYFIPYPPGELINFHGEIDDLWGKHSLYLIDKIRDRCRNTKDRIDFLNHYLHQCLNDRHKEVPAIDLALNVIDKVKGQVNIHGLSKVVGLSTRQLERRFKERVGISPKQLCRNLRFKNVLKHLSGSPADSWSDVALSCGYYDQAHMIRDFKHFTSTSPGAYFSPWRHSPEVVTAIF